MASPQPNILYLVAHDLRPDVLSHAPELRALVTEPATYTFTHAFTQAPYCTPSRHSFVTGRHPARTRVHGFLEGFNLTRSKIQVPEGFNSTTGILRGEGFEALRRPTDSGSVWTALPHAFVKAGYDTWGIGTTLSEKAFDHCPSCWSSGYVQSCKGGGDRVEVCRGFVPGSIGGTPVQPFCEEQSHRLGVPQGLDWTRALDWCFAGMASRWLRQRQSSARPFFAMVGFWGGHIPYRYNGSDGELSLQCPFDRTPRPGWAKPPTAASPFALVRPHSVYDKQYAKYRRLLRAREREWGAAVGHLVDTITNLSLWNSTAFIMHADHGLSVYDFHTLGKGKLLDVDTRVPFVLRLPAEWGAAGRAHEARALSTPIELLDVYPTLCDIAGITTCPRRRHESRGGSELLSRPMEPPLDGRSLVSGNGLAAPEIQPGLLQPATTSLAKGAAAEAAAHAATSVYSRCTSKYDHAAWTVCNDRSQNEFEFMGTSVRTVHWRYVVWAKWDAPRHAPVLGPLHLHLHADQVELYEYSGREYDSECAELAVEKVNLAGRGIRFGRLWEDQRKANAFWNALDALHSVANATWSAE